MSAADIGVPSGVQHRNVRQCKEKRVDDDAITRPRFFRETPNFSKSSIKNLSKDDDRTEFVHSEINKGL